MKRSLIMLVDRKPIFQTVKALRKGQGFTLAEVQLLDAAIDAALTPGPVLTAVTEAIASAKPAHRVISPKGEALIHSFEQCKLEAYPDPGSRDGNPWTIGWGSTGPDIKKGVRWTQAECDARFRRDIAKYEKAVDDMTKDVPTNQNQFDALVSLAYNIGTGAIGKSTVMRKHRARDYPVAARAFLMWNRNDGRIMRGLTRRRLAEADLYDNP